MEIVDVYEKSIQLDPQAVWIVVETRITNQDGALVAVGRNVGLSHREPAEVAANSAVAADSTVAADRASGGE